MCLLLNRTRTDGQAQGSVLGSAKISENWTEPKPPGSVGRSVVKTRSHSQRFVDG